MGWKVKQVAAMMKEPMTLLPLAPKSSYQTLRVWSCGLLRYPHWGEEGMGMIDFQAI
jgi:hypothetical protein